MGMVKSYAEANGRSKEWVSAMVQQVAGASELARKAETARTTLNNVAQANRDLEAAARGAAGGVNDVNGAMGKTTEAGQKAIAQLQRQLALYGKTGTAAGMLYDIQRARQGKGTFSEYSSNELDELEAGYRRLAKMESARGGQADRSSGIKQNAEALERLAHALDDVGLSAREVVVVNAERSLNKYATPEQIKRAGELAAKQWDASEALKSQKQDSDVLKDLEQQLKFAALAGGELAAAQAAARMSPFALPEDVSRVKELAAAVFQLNEEQRKREKIGADPSAYVRGDQQPLSGGEFDQQFARYEAEAKAEEKRYADQLKRLQEVLAVKKMTQEQANAEEEQLARDHASRLEQIERAKQQVLLSAAESGFGAAADGLKDAFGEQNALYKAAFVAQKAFAIAQSMIAIQQGIALAAANPWPMNLAAMASVAAATAGLISNISSVGLAIGGGRQYGGAVDATKMYRVNETGQPEVLNMANGQQYLIPNSRGDVVSNKDATSGGAGITVIIENTGAPAAVSSQSYDQEARILRLTIAETARQVRNNEGAIWSAFKASTNVSGRM